MRIFSITNLDRLLGAGTMTLDLRLNIFTLKPISKVFLLAEFLDLLTTSWGLSLFPQVSEANPLPALMGGWLPMVALKLAAVILVVYVLERVRTWPAFVKVIPVAAMLPAVWNLICILAELATRSF